AIFGSLAAWYVNDILAEVPPPAGILPAEVRHGRKIAFKTGTSYGYRDFWAIGYDSEVSIGVWAGRPDGTPMPGHSGRQTAAPVLFKIADLLGPSRALNAASPLPGVPLVSRNGLPPRLQRLELGTQAMSQTRTLVIVYPPDGALIEWS